MRPPMGPLTIFKVVENDGAWSVEHEGVLSDRTIYKAEAVASATKLARGAALQGQRTQVRIVGETGYF